MLQDSESCISKFVNQINGSVNVKQVIIRNLLTVDLVEHSIDVAVEITFLMWVFTVTQCLLIVGRLTESRSLLTVEVIENSRIVMRRNGESFFGKPTALFDRSNGSMFHQHITQRLVLSL